MTETLRQILSPDTVAIVGASSDKTKRGYRTIRNLRDAAFEGEMFAVNPKYDGTICGVEVYPTVRSIPAHVDVAFVVTPASIVPDVLRDCVDAEVLGAVVIAAGFGESGNEALEQEVKDIVHGSELRLIGPNIQGLINTHEGVDLIGGYHIPSGQIGLLTQSGNVGVALAEEAAQRRSVGFSYNIGLGNELDVRCHEYLPVLKADPNTDVVAAYVEGLAEARAFLRQARETVQELPIVLFKAGKTSVGQESVSSHTASLAGTHAAVAAAYRQAGVVTVERSDALLVTAESLAALPAAAGDRVGVLSDGGGHATIAADYLLKRGLDVPALTSKTRDRIREQVPSASSSRNPLDIMGQGGDLRGFSRCAEQVLRDPNIDALFITGAFGGYSTYEYLPDRDDELVAAYEIIDLLSQHGKPIVVHSYYYESPTLDLLRDSDVIVCHSVETACECLSGLAQYGESLRVRPWTTDFSDELQEIEPRTQNRRLSEYDSRRLLADYDVPMVPSVLVESGEAAIREAKQFDRPVAMKVSSPDIVHKTDAGCVRLDVRVPDAAVTYDQLVKRARHHAPDATVDGVLISPMVDHEVELFVGTTIDSEVGPVLAFGIGGVFVEVLNDVAFRTLPLTDFDARELVNAIQARAILCGARGTPVVDEDALISFLRTVSTAVLDEPITELDLNPIAASGDDIRALDVSIKR